MSSLKEVAELAGVGIATVSRVINNYPGVSPKTRAKVQRAIDALDYIPDEQARNFKLQTSNMVALFLPYVSNPFLAKVAYHVENELYKHDLKMMLCNSEAHPEKEKDYLDLVSKNKALGIIGITYNDINDFLDTNIPFVCIDRFLGRKIPSVASDNFAGGRMALRALVRSGCKKIAFIGDTGGMHSEVKKRRSGFKHEAEELGITPYFHDKRISVGYLHNDFDFVDKLFEKYPDVDGVFAISDLLAAAVVERARLKGISVPQQLKVIGFDGIQDNDYFSPYLSTIVQPVEQMAKVAVELLLQKIANPKLRTDTQIIPVTYRQGETT